MIEADQNRKGDDRDCSNARPDALDFDPSERVVQKAVDRLVEIFVYVC